LSETLDGTRVDNDVQSHMDVMHTGGTSEEYFRINAVVVYRGYSFVVLTTIDFVCHRKDKSEKTTSARKKKEKRTSKRESNKKETRQKKMKKTR
jgi:hypothetical protein